MTPDQAKRFVLRRREIRVHAAARALYAERKVLNGESAKLCALSARLLVDTVGEMLGSENVYPSSTPTIRMTKERFDELSVHAVSGLQQAEAFELIAEILELREENARLQGQIDTEFERNLDRLVPLA